MPIDFKNPPSITAGPAGIESKASFEKTISHNNGYNTAMKRLQKWKEAVIRRLQSLDENSQKI